MLRSTKVAGKISMTSLRHTSQKQSQGNSNSNRYSQSNSHKIQKSKSEKNRLGQLQSECKDYNLLLAIKLYKIYAIDLAKNLKSLKHNLKIE